MNLNMKKAALVFGASLTVLMGSAPAAWAAGVEAPLQAEQQAQRITGTVLDANGDPIIGASVTVKGTNKGVVTDIDGNFTLDAQPGSTLVVSYVGYYTQEVNVDAKRDYTIRLQENATTLDEVVAVGYGTQKKKLLTGASVQVSGEDIEKLNTVSVLGAMQSQTPGVNIQAVGGQPGDGFKVMIRGAGTNGNTTPLYVIDGVAGGDINNLNPSDIASVDVLKDAASCAIYGSAAANGVILVTTKQGQAGKTSITYDGNVGWQNLYKLPNMLNAKQYMEIESLQYFNSGTPLPGGAWTNFIPEDVYNAYMDGSNPGTDWIDLNRNENAVVTNHSININSGNDRSQFSTGLGYQYQDGIFGGQATSDWRRFTVRVNSSTVLYRDSKGMDVITVGENLYFNHKENQGIAQGNQYWNTLFDSMIALPIIPLYNENGDLFDGYNCDQWGLSSYTQFPINPVYMLKQGSQSMNKSKSFGFNLAGWVEIQPIPGLKYRGQVSYNQSSWMYRDYSSTYYMNSVNNSTVDSASNQAGLGWGWGTTNTLTYDFRIGQNHIDLLAGMEYGESRPGMGMSVGASASNSIFGNFEQAYLSYMKNNNNASAWANSYGDSRNVSYFGRVNYNYAETYMLSAILRADGSSTFAPGKRWGYFPSVSGAWIISNEPFMEDIQETIGFLKLRAGWGQNGSRNIGAFQYQAAYAFDNNASYSFDNNKYGITNGAIPSRLPNPDITWETSEQLDLGLDAQFFNNRLKLTADYYVKTTRDLLLWVPVPATTGFTSQAKNAGTVQNKGVEVALNWSDRVNKDFSYSIGWNMAYNKNKVTEVKSEQKFNNGESNILSQSTGFVSRFEEGQPIGYFYGFKTDGVMQNWAEVQAYLDQNCNGNAANSMQGTNIKPGDLKFIDFNGDGIINDDDKTYMGDPNPDVTMGLNIGVNYKGFDLNITGYAALGHQIARSYRRFGDSPQNNFTQEVYSYWNGEGTSNRYPILELMGTSQNWLPISDIYIDDASYFRMQNVTLGYDFNRVWKTSPFQQLRLYVAAQNLFTVTKYPGMDPENGRAVNGDLPWQTGIDLGNYPQPRTYMVGVNVTF